MDGLAPGGSLDLTIDKAFATSTAAFSSPFLYSNSTLTMEKLATLTELISRT